MTSITSLGLGSGLDLESLIGSLVSSEGSPEQLRISQQEAEYQAELSALGSFRSALDAFNSALDNLSDLESFNKRTASSSNEALFTVTATRRADGPRHRGGEPRAGPQAELERLHRRRHGGGHGHAQHHDRRSDHGVERERR
jgi:hypothetical protein